MFIELRTNPFIYVQESNAIENILTYLYANHNFDVTLYFYQQNDEAQWI